MCLPPDQLEDNRGGQQDVKGEDDTTQDRGETQVDLPSTDSQGQVDELDRA